jgi:hypothetical protein
VQTCISAKIERRATFAPWSERLFGAMMAAMARIYRALIKRAGGPSGGTALRPIAEHAESSLGGIHRTSLTDGACSIRSSALTVTMCDRGDR